MTRLHWMVAPDVTLHALTAHYAGLVAKAEDDKARYHWLIKQPSTWTRADETALVAAGRAYSAVVADPRVVLAELADPVPALFGAVS